MVFLTSNSRFSYNTDKPAAYTPLICSIAKIYIKIQISKGYKNI